MEFGCPVCLGAMRHNGLQLGLVPAIRKVKCTNVQRDAKIANCAALGQTAVRHSTFQLCPASWEEPVSLSAQMPSPLSLEELKSVFLLF